MEKSFDPVKFDEVEGVHRLNAKTMNRFFEHGIVMKDVDPPRPIIPTVAIDVEGQKQKNDQFGENRMWNTEEQFLKQFENQLNLLKNSEKTRIIKLLIEFAPFFYNEEKPEYFREGLRVPPIEIYVTDKQQRVNDTKALYLRKHIKKMEK
jgi:hypothetical protein